MRCSEAMFDQSESGERQKPGMCFEDYARLQSEKIRKQYERRQKQEKKDQTQLENQHGFQYQQSERVCQMSALSKLKNCSTDRECTDSEKCCSTVCGMRCTTAMFETSENGEVQTPGMCFDDYVMSQLGKLSKLLESEQGVYGNGVFYLVTEWSQPKSQNGSESSSQMPDLSKRTSCALDDNECDDSEKCCKTICGMRCIEPIFDKSKNGEIQKHGMCFEEYYKLQAEKFKTMYDSHQTTQYGQLEEKIDWIQPKSQTSSPSHGTKKGWQKPVLSKPKSCSVDGECTDSEKCCKTMCGMKCTAPMFVLSENGKKQGPGMCFEEYHNLKVEKAKKKYQHSNGSQPDWSKMVWEMPDLSKLKSCSVDGECADLEKCCWTLCGMKCTMAMFDASENGEVQKPGMCSDDYHKLQLEQWRQQKKDWLKNQNGSQRQGSERFRPDLSKLRNCSLNSECDGSEKCGMTIMGLKCIKLMFDRSKMEEHRENVNPASNNELDVEDAEQPTRQKQHASKESGEWSEEKTGGATSGEDAHQMSREKQHSSKEISESSKEKNGGEPGEDQGMGRENFNPASNNEFDVEDAEQPTRQKQHASKESGERSEEKAGGATSGEDAHQMSREKQHSRKEISESSKEKNGGEPGEDQGMGRENVNPASNNELDVEDAEQPTRQKQHAIKESGERSEEKAGGATSGEEAHQMSREKQHSSKEISESSKEKNGGESGEDQGMGREKRSEKEKGKCKGKGEKEHGGG